MQLNFTNLFNGSNEIIDINYKVNFDDFYYCTYQPLKNGAKAVGKAYSKAEVVYLDLNISFDFVGVCDRCADEVNKQFFFDVSKIVVQQTESDRLDNDDYLIVENCVLNLDDLLYEEIQLFLPTKMLCNDDCKGLCQSCGKNLNYEKCDCKKEVDSRLAALLELQLDE